MAKTILIVDDSASLRHVVETALHRAGYDVVQAENGQDALEKLGTGVKPHLIVCDVNMPVMDGIAFVKEAKSLPQHRFTPIIMLTTESRETRKLQAQTAGAKAWMLKPFKPDVLLSAVQKLILP
ncbi:MAG: response regulator [Betaproteobacteria bacterium]|nr:response regulator [Betaproteobacteria bacterium]